MATYKRLPRGRKKSTNELATFLEKVYALVHERWKTVVAVCVMSVVMVVVIIGGYKYVGWRATNAANALAQTKTIDDVSDRREALVSVFEEYKGTAAAREAALLLGRLADSGDDAEVAANWFEELSEQSRSYPILKVYAFLQQGRAYEELGRFEDAAEVYQAASRVKGNFLKGQSMYDEARCREKLGAYGDASELYRAVIDTAAEEDIVLKAKSEERLLWLMATRNITG